MIYISFLINAVLSVTDSLLDEIHIYYQGNVYFIKGQRHYNVHAKFGTQKKYHEWIIICLITIKMR